MTHHPDQQQAGEWRVDQIMTGVGPKCRIVRDDTTPTGFPVEVELPVFDATNAAIVADAINVYAATGRTPRQLADERELLWHLMLRPCAKHSPRFSSFADELRAIAEILDQHAPGHERDVEYLRNRAVEIEAALARYHGKEKSAKSQQGG